MAASEARALGYGGVSLVRQACGLSRKAISKGLREINTRSAVGAGRIRRPGGGRKPITVSDPRLVDALEAMIEDQTRGDPESPLRVAGRGARRPGRQRTSGQPREGRPCCPRPGLQSNRKTEEGRDHPDRDAQFRHIAAGVKRCLAQGSPVISVDTKKKELIGNYANAGQQWRPAKQPRTVRGHDFPTPDVPRAYPYGIYDVGRNTGFVNIGTDHDTGAFAVASIRGWWRHEGQRLYPAATTIRITADGGGSNGWRLRLWKLELQTFADATGLPIAVSHFPPGTSKWNKIEHRLFSFISSNWRGEPLRDYETVVNLIAKTTTAKGLTVTCRLDRRKYPTGRKVTSHEDSQSLPRRFGDHQTVIRPHQSRRHSTHGSVS